MKKLKYIPPRIFLYIFLILQFMIVMYPIFLMVNTSFKSMKDIFENPYGLPKIFYISNYLDVFRASNYDIYFRNSILISLTSIILILFIASIAAYILAKYQFFLKKFLYIYLLAGIMVPIKLGTIKIVQILSKLHLTDNLLGLIIIYTATGIPLGVFILTGYIREIPEELSNAARIDGCSDYGIFFRIILPMIKPGLSAVAIISLLHIWNDFWWPLILIRSENLKTVPLAVTALYGQFMTEFGKVFASLTVASVPFIIFYLILSKQFIKGLSEGAFKG